ncbi:MAG: hypothetical protein HFI92_12000 [Lachnospiraceae bacterium]|nr:hypothetical protein [Lachnospiraceae bacterium]
MESVKNGAKLSVILGAAFAMMTGWFGGGWATGQFAVRYSTQFGWYGLFLPVVGVGFICIIAWIIVEWSRLNNTWNYGDFMGKFYGTPIIKVIFDVIQVISLPISFAGCTATFGSILQTYLGGNYIMWMMLFNVIVLFSVIWGTEVVNRLASVMGVLILAILIIVFGTIIGNGYGSHVGELVATKTVFTDTNPFYGSSIGLFMLTAGMALSILPCFSGMETREDVTKTCLWSFLFCGVFIFIVSFNVLSFAPETLTENIPVLYIIQSMGARWLVPLYVLIVCLAVVSTGNAMCNGYSRRFMNFKFLSGWKSSDMVKMIVISVIILGISTIVSLMGITMIFQVAYGYVAILNAPLVSFGITVIGIVKMIQIKRCNISLERNSMENMGSWSMFKK